MAKKSRTNRSAGGAAGGLRGLGVAAWVGIGVVVALGAFLLAREQATGGGEAVEAPARGLPPTPDYHSLLVDAEDPERLLLGTHVGIYASEDGGETWRFAALEGEDAMHFAREDDGTIWAAGHDVLERSEDGGNTWDAVRPEGLPHLDIHGFAVGQDHGLVYAALAGEGLYRSDDAGATFRLISKNVGPGVHALAVTKHGLLFAADAETGVQVNANGDGVEWTRALDMAAAGLAHNWRDPPDFRLLAAGSELRLLESDSGDWETVLEAEEGLGPVAFAPSDPDIAYAIAFDRTLYRSDDGGRTWKPRS